MSTAPPPGGWTPPGPAPVGPQPPPTAPTPAYGGPTYDGPAYATTPYASPPADLSSPPAEPIRGSLRYHELLQRGRPGWWRVLVGLPFLVVLALVVQTGVVLVLGVALAVRGDSVDSVSSQLAGDPATPAFLGAVNLGWALTIPAVLLVTWVMHRVRPGWVASVAGRTRWRWMAACFGLALVALVATLVVSALVPQQSDGAEISGRLNDFTAQTRDFLLVVVLLTPLQAAGEEYAFRGYLTQAFGGLLSGMPPRVGQAVAVIVPSLLFAAAHGLGQDAPIFVDRLAFGLVAGVLTIATGGLEAAIAMHVLNNFLAFGLALAFGDMSTALEPTGGSWWSLPVTLTQSIVYTALAIVVARRIGLITRSEPAVLSPPGQRV